MPNTSELEAMHTFERLQQTLSQPLKVHEDGEEVWLQPYTGAVVSRSNEPAIVLIEQAEAALSRASLNGSTPVFYSPELTAEASQELTAEPSQVDKEE
jgi:PleD family two-component response regulator